ncbi:MAG: pyocin knob domain-containing S74 family peptidase [Pseudomonas sp.]|nr:pyocin knob domain-containing S74 family peptidase [Pseudomonas sp.]
MGFLGIKFPEGFTPIPEVVGNELLMLYSPTTGKIHQSELGLLPFGVDEQAVIDLVNTNTSVNVYNAARLGGQLPNYYAPASSLNNYYTKTSIDAFFAGTTAKTGYNKSNWDDAYTDRLKWDGGSTGLNATTGRTSLGLGTATRDAQTSLTDTTEGRLMEVGAFGLGGSSGLSRITNANTHTITGFWRAGANWTGSPYPGTVGQNQGGLIHLSTAGDSSYAIQLYGRMQGNNLFFRHKNNNSWSSWVELYHTDNLVNPIQGSGEANYIPKFTAGATLGNSSIYESGGAIIAVGDINTYNHRILAASAGGDRYIELNRGGSTYGTTAYRDWMIKANAATSIQFLGKLTNTETLLAEISSGGNFYSQTASIGKTSVTSGYMLDVNGAIRAAGNIYATGNITGAGEVTAYTASDARLKTNITSLNNINALDIITALNPVTYTWNDRAVQLNGNKNTTSINYGLIAQELEAIVPDLIRPIYGDYKTYDDRGLMTIILQAIKELKAEVDELKNKN